jgi:hypothetical protein
MILSSIPTYKNTKKWLEGVPVKLGEHVYGSYIIPYALHDLENDV